MALRQRVSSFVLFFDHVFSVGSMFTWSNKKGGTFLQILALQHYTSTELFIEIPI